MAPKLQHGFKLMRRLAAELSWITCSDAAMLVKFHEISNRLGWIDVLRSFSWHWLMPFQLGNIAAWEDLNRILDLWVDKKYEFQTKKNKVWLNMLELMLPVPCNTSKLSRSSTWFESHHPLGWSQELTPELCCNHDSDLEKCMFDQYYFTQAECFLDIGTHILGISHWKVGVWSFSSKMHNEIMWYLVIFVQRGQCWFCLAVFICSTELAKPRIHIISILRSHHVI